MTIGVVIGTYGSGDWYEDGEFCAEEALATSGADKVVHIHDWSLAAARNAGAEEIGTDHIVFLDADDKLAPGYCDVLRTYLEPGNLLYQPETLGWYGDEKYDEYSSFIPDRDMNVSNNLIIGTAVTASHMVQFDPALPALEDWDFFLRMISQGAKVKQCPGLIYHVGIHDDSRNANEETQNISHNIILRKGIKVSDYRV